MEEIKKNDIEFLESKVIKIEDIFKDLSRIVLNQRKLDLFLNGVKLSSDYEDGIYKVYDDRDVFIGTGEVKDKRLKRDVVI